AFPSSALSSIFSLLSVFVIGAIVLDEGLQSTDRRIPFGRDLVEGAPRLLETLGLQLVDPLASATEISHQPNAAKGAQLLGDCLASDACTLTEVRDGERTFDTEPAGEPRPGVVAEGGEHWRCVGQL